MKQAPISAAPVRGCGIYLKINALHRFFIQMYRLTKAAIFCKILPFFFIFFIFPHFYIIDFQRFEIFF